MNRKALFIIMMVFCCVLFNIEADNTDYTVANLNVIFSQDYKYSVGFSAYPITSLDPVTEAPTNLSFQTYSETNYSTATFYVYWQKYTNNLDLIISIPEANPLSGGSLLLNWENIEYSGDSILLLDSKTNNKNIILLDDTQKVNDSSFGYIPLRLRLLDYEVGTQGQFSTDLTLKIEVAN